MSWYTGAQPATGDTFHLQNITITEIASATAVSLAPDLIVTGGIVCSGAIQCVSLVQTSDEAIKQNVAAASLDELQSIFDEIEVKTYERTDIPGSRVGMIAQDVQAAIPIDSRLQNLVHTIYTDKAPLLGLDYSRLASTVLWGALKYQQNRLDELMSRVSALENMGKRTKKTG